MNCFNNNINTYNYGQFLQTMSRTEIFVRPPSKLYYLYWGLTNLTPLSNNTGLENVAILLDVMWSREISDYHAIMTLPDIWNITQVSFPFLDPVLPLFLIHLVIYYYSLGK